MPCSDLEARAARVLRANDAGDFTRAAPALYPHQWSWDSAIIAIGLAHLDPARAARELRSLFAAQWATGLVPHIVFNPEVGAEAYFPDADRWASHVSPHAPADVRTSGLCQPPVHAIAARRIGDADFLRWIYPRLLAYHRYLATERDPQGSGLVTIFHPWESGADNSPRWDAALAAVEVGDLPAYRRRDVGHVADPAQRPSDADYDRYLWLVELMRFARYDDRRIRADHPFQVKDVLFSAILVAANHALLEIAAAVDAPSEEREAIEGWIDRGARGVAERWDPDTGLCLDYDLRAGRPLRARTIAGFAPLLVPSMPAALRMVLLDRLDSEDFLGHPGLRWRVPPTTSPADPAFDPRNYWRGPTWPVVNWLMWTALLQSGEPERAERLRHAALEQVRDGGLVEYFDPFNGEALGAAGQSWTAAVTIDWLAYSSTTVPSPSRSAPASASPAAASSSAATPIDL